jgi:hypothetical protein
MQRRDFLKSCLIAGSGLVITGMSSSAPGQPLPNSTNIRSTPPSHKTLLENDIFAQNFYAEKRVGSSLHQSSYYKTSLTDTIACQVFVLS